eukprot:scaffold55139_cov51-Phaeocystis_antarctica.AAC.1
MLWVPSTKRALGDNNAQTPYSGRGARHTDGRDRGAYMYMCMCMLHVHAERPSSSVVTFS